MDSPSSTSSQKTISDDEEIDYSVKPEFYDPDLDSKDEEWVQNRRKASTTDAVLSCPACFTTLCLECQRHEQFLTQYRAVFVVNCQIKQQKNSGVVVVNQTSKRKRKNGSQSVDKQDENLKCVCCEVCSTEVGVVDEDEVYHFFNVIPSEA
ncbi:hypothetical protein ACHQM5_028563 [Ranunculus cassubicifolius]